jgi:hypothetical protein
MNTKAAAFLYVMTCSLVYVHQTTHSRMPKDHNVDTELYEITRNM